MDIKEFLDLKNKLQQFEEEHSLELSEVEARDLLSVIGMVNEYIVGLEV